MNWVDPSSIYQPPAIYISQPALVRMEGARFVQKQEEI